MAAAGGKHKQLGQLRMLIMARLASMGHQARTALQQTVLCASLARPPACHAGMIRALVARGFRSIHIMAHSLGVRVVMASIPLLEQLFDPSSKATCKLFCGHADMLLCSGPPQCILHDLAMQIPVLQEREPTRHQSA